MMKVLTVGRLKEILDTLKDDIPVSLYDTDNGERIYIREEDIDPSTPGIIDINFNGDDRGAESFIEDIEKVDDLLNLSRDEFLSSYRYLTEGDVSLTIKEIEDEYTAFAVWFFIRTQQTLANDAMGINSLAVKGTKLMETFINVILPHLGEVQAEHFWEVVNSKNVDVDKKYTLKAIADLVYPKE